MTNKIYILPSYQRFINGVPVPLFSRRSIRLREKYLILLVFLTFGIVCFGTFFFLPDFRSAKGSVAYNSVYNVYQKIQKVGPDLLLPAPPHGVMGPLDPHGPGGYFHAFNVGLERPGDVVQDIHLIEDKLKLQAKINEDNEQQKTLEKPEIVEDSRTRVTSSAIPLPQEDHQHEEAIVIVPPAPADVLPTLVGGEDKDPIARQRRDKVKEFDVATASCKNFSWPYSVLFYDGSFHFQQPPGKLR